MGLRKRGPSLWCSGLLVLGEVGGGGEETPTQTRTEWPTMSSPALDRLGSFAWTHARKEGQCEASFMSALQEFLSRQRQVDFRVGAPLDPATPIRQAPAVGAACCVAPTGEAANPPRAIAG